MSISFRYYFKTIRLLPIMDLWVKAGSDGVRLGGDPVSHQLFMILILKSAEDSDSDRSLKFNVRTVNDAKPPEEFKQVLYLEYEEICNAQFRPDCVTHLHCNTHQSMSVFSIRTRLLNMSTRCIHIRVSNITMMRRIVQLPIYFACFVSILKK